jgi:di/tricarboxylate transporter
MLIPFVLGLADRAKIPPSKLLMPLAFGTIMGGSCLLIGTSTNLAVSGAMQRFGMEPYSMFELTPVGVIVALLGIVYMLTIGRKLLAEPRRRRFVDRAVCNPRIRFRSSGFARLAFNR